MEFDWDPVKDKANQRKHGLGFSRAAMVFADPRIMTLFDRAHSDDEERFLSLGRDQRGLVLLVCHTYRKSPEGEMIRIISARLADKDEELVYYGEDEAK